MADNTRLNQGVGGDLIATDEIDEVKHQKVKVEWGIDGEAHEVTVAQEVLHREHGPLPVRFGDSVNMANCGRLRTVDSVVMFESTFVYDRDDILWHNIHSGEGFSYHKPDLSVCELATRTGVGDLALRQTREYFPYEPGTNHIAATTFVMGGTQSGVRQRVGYFDNDNGVFLERVTDISGTIDSAAVSNTRITLRTNTGGNPLETQVLSTRWNIDRFNGLGPSKATLDLTKQQTFYTNVSQERIVAGFVMSGFCYPAHEFIGTNVDVVGAGPLMSTLTLPIRLECGVTGKMGSQLGGFQALSGEGASGLLRHSQSMLISEGGSLNRQGYRFSARPEGGFGSNSTTGVYVKNNQDGGDPVFGMRLMPTFSGRVNRIKVIPESVSVYSRSGNALVRVARNWQDQNIWQAPNWTGANTGSAVLTLTEYNGFGFGTVWEQAMRSGQVLEEFFVPEGQTVSRDLAHLFNGVTSRYPLTVGFTGSQIDGASPANYDNLMILAQTEQSLPGQTNGVVYPSITWREIR